LVVMESSVGQWPVVGGQWSVNASRSTLLWFGHTWNRKNRAEDLLVATEEAGTQA
jgi:hypothetical protein